MGSDRPYARVYYVDLERDYPQVWRDDALLATYVRLLCVAEAMWPGVPEVPRSARSANVKRLVEASLVKLVPPYGFRIKGMDAERSARRNAARIAAAARWSDAPAMPNRAEPNQTKPTSAQARTNGKEPILIDEQNWTLEQRSAAYIERQEKRTGVKG